jgi:hypothetical protein
LLAAADIGEESIAESWPVGKARFPISFSVCPLTGQVGKSHRLRKLGLDVKQQYPHKVYDEDGALIDGRSASPLCHILTCSKLRRIKVETQRARRNAEEKSLFFLPSLRPSANLCVSALRLF